MILLLGDPLFHSKLRLMKQFMKAQNKEGFCLKQIRESSLILNDDTAKGGMFLHDFDFPK